MPWLISFMSGFVLALALFALVRIRMRVGPIVRERFGNWARRGFWGLIFALLIASANLMLIMLRQVLINQYAVADTVMHEVLFAAVAFCGGFFLVYRHALLGRQRSRHDVHDVGPAAGHGDQT